MRYKPSASTQYALHPTPSQSPHGRAGYRWGQFSDDLVQPTERSSRLVRTTERMANTLRRHGSRSSSSCSARSSTWWGLTRGAGSRKKARAYSGAPPAAPPARHPINPAARRADGAGSSCACNETCGASARQVLRLRAAALQERARHAGAAQAPGHLLAPVRRVARPFFEWASPSTVIGFRARGGTRGLH